MPAERFYINSPLEGTVFLEGTELHHLAHVMRVRVGETVELVNGKGGLASARVVAIGKKEGELEVISTTISPLPAPGLFLAIPLMRPSKLELIVEKCTELGASAFFFYPADHSEKGDLSNNQFDRLLHIAISAMKQCGRLDLPKLEVVGSLEEILQMPGPHFFGDPRAKSKWNLPKHAFFITGPERGFSDREEKLLNNRATSVLLHLHTLRAETAPIAAACYFAFQAP